MKKFDAIVIGAGFAGLYALKVLRDDLKLSVKVIEKAEDVGGTWYWNRYPGCQSDVEAFVYCYSFDKELLKEAPLNSRYITQPELFKYFRKVAERHDLYKDIAFGTGVRSAAFDEGRGTWQVQTDKGETLEATYLITAVGVLSATNIPRIAGLDRFKGEWHHTSRWPAQVDLRGKRVAVIGTGSTGVQLTTAIAPEVAQLTVFQRTPQFSVPAGNRPLSEAEANEIRRDYEQIWRDAKDTMLAAGFKESTTPAMSVSEQEREAVFERAWNNGGGFRFMFGTFGDIATDEQANAAAQKFLRRKIAETVKDPETARKLTPQGLYAKRPICDSGYYATFNRDNVSLVDLRATPIDEITEAGIRTADGVEHKFDMILFATGFDAGDGNLRRMEIRGPEGLTVAEAWKQGPASYLGVASQGYPNLFMVLGPNSPFSNIPPVTEVQVDWIAEVIRQARSQGATRIEAAADAQAEWGGTCSAIADMTLFNKVDSWIFGGNIAGKPQASYFYLGGLGNYLATLQQVRSEGYKGFRFS